MFLQIILGGAKVGGFFGFFHIITRMPVLVSIVCALGLYLWLGKLMDYGFYLPSSSVSRKIIILGLIAWSMVVVGYIGIGADLICKNISGNHQEQEIRSSVAPNQTVATASSTTNKKDMKAILIKSVRLFGIITLTLLVIIFILAGIFIGKSLLDGIHIIILIPIILGLVFGLIELVCGSIWGISMLRWYILLGCGLAFPIIFCGLAVTYTVAMAIGYR